MGIDNDIKFIPFLKRELNCLTYVKEIIGFKLLDGDIYLEYKDQTDQIVNTSIKLNVFSQLTGDYINDINSFELDGNELVLKYTNKQGQLLEHRVNIRQDHIKSIEGFSISNNKVNLSYTDQDSNLKVTSFKLRRVREITSFNLNNDHIVLRYINEENSIVQKKIALNSKVSSVKDIIGLELNGNNLVLKYTNHSDQVVEKPVELKYIKSISSFTYDKATDTHKLNYIDENGISKHIDFQIGSFLKSFESFGESNGNIVLNFKDYSNKLISKSIDLKYIKSISNITYDSDTNTYSFTVKDQNNVNSVKSFVVNRVRNITSFTTDNNGKIELKYIDSLGKSKTRSINFDYVKKLRKGFRYNTAEYEYELRYILEDGTELTTGFDIQDNYIKEITDFSESNGELKITYDNHTGPVKESKIQLDYVKDITSLSSGINPSGNHFIILKAVKSNGDPITKNIILKHIDSPKLTPYLRNVSQHLVPKNKKTVLKLFGAHFDKNTVFKIDKRSQLRLITFSAEVQNDKEAIITIDTKIRNSDSLVIINISAYNNNDLKNFGEARLKIINDLRVLIPNDNATVSPIPGTDINNFDITKKGIIAHKEIPLGNEGVFFGRISSNYDFELEFTYYAYTVESEAYISIIENRNISKDVNDELFLLLFSKYMALDVYVNSDKKHLLGYPADYRTKYRIYYNSTSKDIIIYKNNEVLFSDTIIIPDDKDLYVKLRMIKKSQFQDLVLRGTHRDVQ